MWNKIKNYLVILLIMILGGSTYFSYKAYKDKPKLGFIDIQKVFDEFNLKKDLQKRLLQNFNRQRAKLDSMKLELQVQQNKLEQTQKPNKDDVADFVKKRDEYYLREKNYQAKKDSLSAEYDKEILQQMNQYVQEYGKQNGYTYIYGSDKNGSLMYAGPEEDLTPEIIKYLNSKYSGN